MLAPVRDDEFAHAHVQTLRVPTHADQASELFSSPRELPRIARGRGGWLGLTPQWTFTPILCQLVLALSALG